MRFCQLDQITHLEAGLFIEAKKYLSGDEDYLSDHFPRFPVMPGVLMLEALFQASALLVRATEDYRTGLVLLRTAKNVKFADFVEPGQTLDIRSDLIKREGTCFTLKAQGTKAGSPTVSGRLVLECAPETQPEIVAKHACQYMRQLTDQLKLAAVAGE